MSNSSWTRYRECAEALERLEKLRQEPDSKYPNFLAITWPEGGEFKLTYGDLGMLFRWIADHIEAQGYIQPPLIQSWSPLSPHGRTVAVPGDDDGTG